jgi:DNA-binding MarR family transcriptional regulator
MPKGQIISELVHELTLKCLYRDEKIRGETDLSPSEYRAITLLNEDEQLSASLFAEKLELSPSRSSRVITKMEADGYISVEKNAIDKRSIFITLTELGAEIRGQILSNKESCNSKLEELLNEDEQNLIVENIKKLLKVL